MTDIPAEAVEAAARALCIVSVAEPSGRRLCADHREWLDDRDLCAGCMAQARAVLTAAAPHIATQERTTAGAMTELFKAEHEKNRDLRAGIEALRDEWRRREQAGGLAAAHASRDSEERLVRVTNVHTCHAHADALDALLRERAR